MEVFFFAARGQEYVPHADSARPCVRAPAPPGPCLVPGDQSPSSGSPGVLSGPAFHSGGPPAAATATSRPAETRARARPPAIGDTQRARSPGAALPPRASAPGSRRRRRRRARAAQVKEEKKGGKNRKQRRLQQRSAAGLGQAGRRTREPAIQGRGGSHPGRAGLKKKSRRRRPLLREGGPRAACSGRGAAAPRPGAEIRREPAGGQAEAAAAAAGAAAAAAAAAAASPPHMTPLFVPVISASGSRVSSVPSCRAA
ncbi:uncharacterized protein LOC111161391 [Enhydra lutris kenyoni]|uniref:Uncharacterized protein LOC111161391 n=1 Tax=Enhydra lutris kenyoni TaxID=391180 RepID=A0A2Y9LAU4_ENHLU|nr:uncharacterized protein LOC111161391 [Enhydra lutris kenyoni]